jgi:hypothetical protein
MGANLAENSGVYREGMLVLATGANTTIFSLANEMLYATLGVSHAEVLRLLTGGHQVGGALDVGGALTRCRVVRHGMTRLPIRFIRS